MLQLRYFKFLTNIPKKHKMLSFGGDCFKVRKLKSKMIEGGLYQSKLICLLEQLLVNLFSEKSI